MSLEPGHHTCHVRKRSWADPIFFMVLALLGGSYILLVLAMVAADASFTSWDHMREALSSPEIRYSIKLSLVSSTASALLSLWVAVPLGYLLSRFEFRGKAIVDALLDIPIVLPPLVIGLSLLILFQTTLGRWFEESVVTLTYERVGVVLAQFAVACAFAVRTMRVCFEQINPRSERVALTLGCTRAQAFWRVVVPEAWRGILTAFTLAWARSLGEFGPIYVFSGVTRMKTEVLSTTIFMELSVGHLKTAVAVSMLMILTAVGVLFLIRLLGSESLVRKATRP